MEKIQFIDDLSIFQNVVTLYRDSNGKIFIGNTYFYNGRDKYISIMYKESLPENMGIIAGWNYLDDNSATITLIPEKCLETGIEDFLYAHGKEKNWHSIEYRVINDYTEIESNLIEDPIKNNEVRAYGIKK